MYVFKTPVGEYVKKEDAPCVRLHMCLQTLNNFSKIGGLRDAIMVGDAVLCHASLRSYNAGPLSLLIQSIPHYTFTCGAVCSLAQLQEMHWSQSRERVVTCPRCVSKGL